MRYFLIGMSFLGVSYYRVCGNFVRCNIIDGGEEGTDGMGVWKHKLTEGGGVVIGNRDRNEHGEEGVKGIKHKD
jgi:hypothetical protein